MGRAAELLAGAALPANVEVSAIDALTVPSRAMSLADVLQLVERVEALASGTQPPDGVVISQGTDTLEETAYLFALMCGARLPVVLTGAMRPGVVAGSDGPANLAAAIAVAAQAEAAALGPLLVFGDEIHAARWVTKVHTSRPAAFASPGAGPVGVVGVGRVRLWGAPAGPILGRPRELSHRVELLTMASGDDGRLAEAAGRYADGLVIAGMGGGHVPPTAAKVLGVLARRMPVVLASRCAAGPVLTSTYRGEGAESDLIAQGLLSVGNLQPLKARLRLIVGLGSGWRPRQSFRSTEAWASSVDFRDAPGAQSSAAVMINWSTS
jgi:L-asparaginase